MVSSCHAEREVGGDRQLLINAGLFKDQTPGKTEMFEKTQSSIAKVQSANIFMSSQHI